jgi:hypothetical protein
MGSRTHWLTRPLMAAMLAGGAGAFAASPAEITAQRQQLLDDMLTTDPPYAIAAERWVCAMGRSPSTVAENRAGGWAFFPDAADGCVTALVRTAHDRRLPELYGKLLTELGGSTDGPERLPKAIGAAVMNGSGKVAIGNGRAAVVTPALAFDAGFSVAYNDQAAAKGVADPGQLKALAEACLGQHQDTGTCFSAGYVYGTQAVAEGRTAAR